MKNTAADDVQSYSLSETKRLIDQQLESYFRTQKVQASLVSKRYERLWETAEKLALSGGKRFRPYMLILAYRAFGSNSIDKIIPAAVACELKHIAMLIQDDIIDRDDVRYGIANVSGQYMEEYGDLPLVDRRHFANSAAMLMGDALLSGAHQLMSTSSDDLVLLRNAQAAFSTAIMHVIGGELIDTESSIRLNEDAHAITIARYKTASYSFIGPLTVGAHLAGADGATISILKQYADSLGIAFQLKDDLLGTFGNSDITGKSNDTDLREGKRTYLIEKFDESADEATKDSFYKLFGKKSLTGNQSEQLRGLLYKSGAVTRTESILNDYVHKAEVALEKLQLTSEHRTEFGNLISACTDREK